MAAFPDNPITKFHENFSLQLNDALSGLPIYEAFIPLEYNENTARVTDRILAKMQ